MLFFRMSSFGDIVLTFPLINEVKKEYPECEIHVFTKNAYKELFELNKNIDKVLTYDESSVFLNRRIVKQEKYDFIADLHKNLKSFFITRFQGVPVSVIKKDTLKKMFLVWFKKSFFSEIIPVYKRYFLAVENVIELKNSDYRISVLDCGEKPLVEGSYVLIAPSSKHFTKALPKEKFELIINSINSTKVVLAGDKSDKDFLICDYLSKKFKNTENYCGRTDFKQLANLIKYAKFIICNDSGVLHLAEALNKKVYVFFGSTVKEFGFYPQLKTTEIFEISGLKCKPCTHIGRDKCPEEHFRCMNDIIIPDFNKKL